MNEKNVEACIDAFLGEGVVLKSVQTNLVRNRFSLGTFDEKRGATGIDSGIILSTGSVKSLIGTNKSAAFTNGEVLEIEESIVDRLKRKQNWLDGDEDLEGLLNSNSNTYDACVVEMEIIPMANTLSFNYVFGSDEYDEYVGSKFNDVFALFISGPGISGQVNLATLPGTEIPISINTVNGGQAKINFDPVNSSFYVRNEGQYNMEYDGFTKLMSIKQKVTPFETYRIKIAIADVADGSLDSGVMLEHTSLISYHADYEVHFESDQSALNSDAKLILDKLTAIYEEKGYQKVMLTGHTDSEGDVAYNQLLSEDRVAEVEEYLIEAGILDTLIIIRSKGELNPIADNARADGKSSNRRVEIKFLGANSEYLEKRAEVQASLKQVSNLGKVYPNPTDERTSIQYSIPSGFKNASIQVYSESGAKITSIRLNLAGEGETLLETASLKSGMYLAALEVDGQRINTHLFAVEH